MDLKRLQNKHELFRLRKGCRKWSEDSIEPDIGKQFSIYSPFSQTYYVSEVTEHTDWNIIDRYIDEGNVYCQQ